MWNMNSKIGKMVVEFLFLIYQPCSIFAGSTRRRSSNAAVVQPSNSIAVFSKKKKDFPLSMQRKKILRLRKKLIKKRL